MYGNSNIRLSSVSKLVVAMLLIMCQTSIAQIQLSPPSSSTTVIDGGPIKISLVVNDQEEGAPFFKPNFPDVRGDNKKPDIYYRLAEMKLGDNYRPAVELQGGLEVLVGVAIDGRHINSGEKVGPAIAELSTWNVGKNYVIRDRIEIPGWREDNNHVRNFVFTTQSHSLAGQWKDTREIGTIVLAFFRKKANALQVQLPTMGGGPNTRSLFGTGAGSKVESTVTETKFEAESTAFKIFVIKYETRESLQKMGFAAKLTPQIKNEKQPSLFWPSSLPQPGQDGIKFPRK
jgi:hypothetical protein